MNKSYIKAILLFLIFIALGYYLGWLDNGPRNVDVETLPSRLDQ